MLGGLGEEGLYHAGTRFLSRLALTLEMRRPFFLSSRIPARSSELTTVLTSAKGVGEIGCVAAAGAVAGALHSYDRIRRVRLPMSDAPATAPLLSRRTKKLRERAASA